MICSEKLGAERCTLRAGHMTWHRSESYVWDGALVLERKKRVPLLERALTWLFGKPEEINGRERCPTYLFRWHLFGCRWFKVYLHKFVADDWSLHLHDHPKRFLSIGLVGGYREQLPNGHHAFRAPWIRTFAAEHTHRVRLLSRVCWTLVAVFSSTRPWGFHTERGWVGWRKYVDDDSLVRVSC